MATKKPADLTGLRAEIARLTADHLTLSADHRGRDEARADLPRYTHAAAAEIEQRFAYVVAIGDMTQAFIVRPRPDGLIDLGPLLAAVLGPDVLASVLERHVLALPPSVDRAARASQLAEIVNQLAEIEEAEEVEVLRLEALGLSPDRRADARPEVVLKLRA